MTLGFKPLRISALCSGTNHKNRSREKAPSRHQSGQGERTARHACSWRFYSFYTFLSIFPQFSA